ncbi:MAG: biopolymer transporter ExbD [Bacteroidetes bacterium]|jgi:biopolymer transport protein ExbD|nr:biopolymer transporter ExbD [Bacteroidota bacterium]MDA1382925.1 biopolymer transporter ExbD [Bacteroidota bacterium]
MARRELQEINAGSMADIAFLLLIFWLVTTTIESDMGIKRQLPPPVPPDIDVPQAKEQNVFNVKVNFLDLLLVEGQPLDIQELKNKTKSFLIATGDGVISHQIGNEEIGKNRDVILITGANGKTNAAFPEREWVRKADVRLKIAEYEQIVIISEEKNKDAFRQVLMNWQEKLTTINLLGGDYKQLPASALISMQNDNNTTYNTYLQVQNELQSAVNELRDELALSKFGVSYRALEEVYEKNKQDKSTLEKITAVRALYPQRISEAEPRDAGATYY